MSAPDQLNGDGVILRRFRESDADDVAAACADPMTQRYLPRLPSPYTRNDALFWINQGSPAQFAAGGAGYAVADPDTDRVLGGCGLRPGSEGTAEIGYWVAPWARGRRVATAACRAVTANAFARGTERVYLRNEPENAPSQRVAIACGFSREGLQRGGGANREGGRHDLIVWARLSDDPEGPTQRLLPDLPGRGALGGGELADEVITLRPVVSADATDMHRLRCLPEVIATSVPPTAPELARIERLCARAESSWLAGERAEFTIRDAATGAYAGEIGLYYFEPPTQQGMIGYSMMPAWRGRGYATRAARLVTRWAFRETGIERIVAGTEPDNIGSQRVLERAGFVREAYERSRLPGPDGVRLDNLQYALLPDQN